MTDPKCRGISFSDRLVPRVLDGSKTVTRRPIKRLLGIGPVTEVRRVHWVPWRVLSADGIVHYMDAPALIARNPYGRPGVDTLYGREACQEFFADELPENRRHGARGRMGSPATPARLSMWAYRAEGELPCHPEHGAARWRPPHLMPRWASRMPLALVSVRPELLSEITAEEVVAEGFAHGDVGRFLAGWDSLYADKPEYQSSADPAVWRIEFRLLETAPWTT